MSARLHHHDYVRPQRRNRFRVILNHTGYCCFFCVFIFVAAVYTAVFVRVLSYQQYHHVTQHTSTFRLQVIVNNFIIVEKRHNCSSTFAVFIVIFLITNAK